MRVCTLLILSALFLGSCTKDEFSGTGGVPPGNNGNNTDDSGNGGGGGGGDDDAAADGEIDASEVTCNDLCDCPQSHVCNVATNVCVRSPGVFQCDKTPCPALQPCFLCSGASWVCTP